MPADDGLLKKHPASDIRANKAKILRSRYQDMDRIQRACLYNDDEHAEE